MFAFSMVHNLDQGLEMGKDQNEKNLKAKKLPPTRQEMMALDQMETDIV